MPRLSEIDLVGEASMLGVRALFLTIDVVQRVPIVRDLAGVLADTILGPAEDFAPTPRV